MPAEYRYRRSVWWGDGHWLIETFNATLGRASKQDNKKWSAYLEWQPIKPGEVCKAIATDLDSIHDVYLALKKARENGRGTGAMAEGPLPMGWHRITWREMNNDHHMLTDSVVAAVLCHTALENKHSASQVKMESWDHWPWSQRPSIEIEIREKK